MALTFATIARPVLKISAMTFRDLVAQRYGDHEDLDTAWHSFEPVARTLVDSFYLTLEDSRFDVLVPRLDAVDVEMRGIAYEGAGMGLTLLDSLFPWRRRLPAFLDGPGAPYRHLVYIGAGLVLPRVPRNPQRFLDEHDPLLRWFVIDGYGFYEGFFSWRRSVDAHRIPARLRGYSRRTFDQGLGRSLWFCTGAHVGRIDEAIGGFAAHRRPDLWSGIGLACAYAAGVADRAGIDALLRAAGPHCADLAVGTALAAVVRAQTGHPAPHTELACEVVWGTDSDEVAHLAELARALLPADGLEPAYEIWRRRIRDSWKPVQLGAGDPR